MRIKNLLVHNALYIAILFTVIIAILSFIKMPAKGLEVGPSDKVSHLIAYFSLTLAWLYTMIKNEKWFAQLKYAILGCFIYGIIIEVLQSTFTSYRTASYLDILANSIGIVLAVLAFHLFEKKIRLI
jgi:VanZ family protein